MYIHIHDTILFDGLFVLSCVVLSCFVLCCVVLCCLVLSRLVMSCLVLMSCRVLSCVILSCLVFAYVLSFVLSDDVFSFHRFVFENQKKKESLGQQVNREPLQTFLLSKTSTVAELEYEDCGVEFALTVTAQNAKELTFAAQNAEELKVWVSVVRPANPNPKSNPIPDALTRHPIPVTRNS